MKDEMSGKKIHEFVGLRPKVYSLKYDGDNTIEEKFIIKGINRNSSERLKPEKYFNVLTLSIKTDCEITQFKWKNQKVSTIRLKMIVSVFTMTNAGSVMMAFHRMNMNIITVKNPARVKTGAKLVQYNKNKKLEKLNQISKEASIEKHV